MAEDVVTDHCDLVPTRVAADGTGEGLGIGQNVIKGLVKVRQYVVLEVSFVLANMTAHEAHDLRGLKGSLLGGQLAL